MGQRPVEVSIVIPTRNRAGDLERCLTALARQSYPLDRAEILVCDDGSTESLVKPLATAERLELPVRHLRQEPAGPAAARNLGIRSALGPIIALTDSDTLPDPEWLAKLVESLGLHPTASGVEGRVFANNPGEFDPLGEGPENNGGGVYLTCNCAYRREALIAAGGFDETFPFPAYEDTELAARIVEYGPIVWQPEAIVLHPQRALTVRTVLKKLRHWEYVLIMGFRYGYLGWKRYPVRHPRLRVAALALLALPLSKFKQALAWSGRSPVAAARLAGLGLVEMLGALVIVLPLALFGDFRNRTIRRRYLDQRHSD
ncbi:MAG: glycosyltransferase family 2 protein [Acidobacteria bacterium]|jgi:glycosyltransferase involved in cell wall biosynthesis|nr:glycosyltransferase family 2 protein [Acidobacteriota bacterium]